MAGAAPSHPEEGTLREEVKLLRVLQERTGLNDANFARLLGVSKAALCRIFGGKTRMGAKTWRGLLRAFPNEADIVMIARALRDG